MLLHYDNMITDENNKKNPQAYYVLSGARRKTGIETLEISPRSIGHKIHTYIAFISDDRERISMSTNIGEIEY